MLNTYIMRKYILLIGLFCLAFMQIEAAIPNDTVIYKGNMKIRIPDFDVKGLNDLDLNFDFDSSQWAEFKESFEFDSSKLLAMQENIRENMKNMPKIKGPKLKNFNFKAVGKDFFGEDQAKTPTRVEKKSFSNISEIEFFHKYGNIIVQESASKQVELEIQYIESSNKKASCTVTATGKLLSIVTDKSASGAKIHYIISVPKDITLNIDLKYGNVRMNRHEGPLSVDLSYSDFAAQSLTRSKPVFDLKYSDVKIDEVEDVSFSASYSDVAIKKGRNLSVKGMYTDYKIDNATSISATGSAAYGDMKIGTVSSITLDTKYTDIDINNLVSDMSAKTAYGDITIKTVSPKLKSIDVTAIYADLALSIPDGMATAFDVELDYGDLNVSKRYNVKYTESKETNSETIKVGQIGSGTPNARIKVKSKYGDIKIR